MVATRRLMRLDENMIPVARKDRADMIKMAVFRWLMQDYNIAMTEYMVDGGRLRADVYGYERQKGIETIVECKTCLHDSQTDKKWGKYIPHCHRFYFASFSDDDLTDEMRAYGFLKIVPMPGKHGVQYLASLKRKSKPTKTYKPKPSRSSMRELNNNMDWRMMQRFALNACFRELNRIDNYWVTNGLFDRETWGRIINASAINAYMKGELE